MPVTPADSWQQTSQSEETMGVCRSCKLAHGPSSGVDRAHKVSLTSTRFWRALQWEIIVPQSFAGQNPCFERQDWQENARAFKPHDAVVLTAVAW